MAVKLFVNGVEHGCDMADAEMTLLDFLREKIHAKDVKCGCNKGYCGSCTVIVNGVNKKSCSLKMKNMDGAVVITAAGINSPKLSKFSKKMHEHGAVQCGFCFPGIACSLESKLADIENPAEKDIKNALSGHICRCTGYIPIIEALMDEKPFITAKNDKFISVGDSPVRPDSEPKLNGSAVYADDIETPDMLHIAVLRSEHAHANIVSIDAAEAKKAAGVTMIITSKELPGALSFGIIRHDQPVLCSGRVRFRGDAIAIIAAATRKQAEDAKHLIKVDYEKLDAISDAAEAMAPGAAEIHDGGNIYKDIKIRSGKKARDYFTSEFVTVSGDFSTVPVEHAYMEPECSVSFYDEKDGQPEILVRSSSQNIHADRSEIAEILGLPEERVNVEFTYAGGGFGGKEDLTTQPYSAIASLLTKKTCKYRFTREESLLCSTKKHPFDIKITLAAEKSGRLAAIEVDTISDIGPYASLSQIVLTRFATHIMGPYEWAAHDISVKGVFTNNLIAGAMRGFGVNQACFALESMIDRLASKLGISAFEIRELNMVRDGRKMGLGEIALDSAGLHKCFEAVSKRFDAAAVNEFNQNNDKRKRAFGIAIAHKNISLGNNSPRDVSSIRISIAHNAQKMTLHTGASDIGQGIYNILAQLASEASGIAIEKISIDFGKTLTAPPAGVTSASRQTFMSGNAVLHGCGFFISALSKRISETLNIERASFEIEGEKIVFTGKTPVAYNDIRTIWDYISAYEKEGFEITYKFDAPPTFESSKAGSEGFRSHFAYSFAAHGVLIETDLETKKFKILNIVAAHDAGRAINPKSLYGQIVGGVVMGLGYAVSEHMTVTDGMPDPKGLAGLGLLKASQVPPVETVIIECPHPEGPFGARGIGEISTVPIAAALCNALRNATGLEFNTLPINMNENGFKYSPEL